MSRTKVSEIGRRTHARPDEGARACAAGSRRDHSARAEGAPGVDVAIVVVTHNSAADLPRLLGSLDADEARNTFEVIVVDNASSDDTVDIARAAGVRCVAQGENSGYAAGINAGVRACRKHAALLVLNPDVVLEPDCMGKLLDAFADPRVGVVVPQLIDACGRCSPSLRREPTLLRALGDALFGGKFRARPSFLSEIVWDNSAYRSDRTVDWATGAVVLISARCEAALGRWDESFFLYSEEIDYCARARAAGFHVRFVPDAIARHSEGGSGGRADVLIALMAINRVRYFERRHARAAAAVFRALVALHELFRSSDPADRRAFFILLRRSRWTALMESLRGAP